jgi:MerR family transcriptional regulator, copper efflux regulator
MNSMTIKKTAELAGVGVETVRFYERENLIPAPPRTASGYRQYSPEAVDRIRFIKRAQALGFSLPEVRELLCLSDQPGTTPADIRDRAQRKIRNIELKIEQLQRMKNSLQRLTEACHGHGPLSECPILEALSSDGEEK